ncbi:MAG TPA: helix-turn-helix domain-containing protein [Candidatus Limnocylindria bacterium]|nr:helix-turn-helix domain-containing protein [Candidatus Limnocylindria bacterium]
MTGTLWLTLGEASRILGVDPDTLRRWADNGKVDVLKTPGGHRRFLRSSIEGMLPRPRQAARQSLTAMGEPPDRIAAEFLTRVRSDLAGQDWHRHFDETSLRWFRERGMRMSDLLIGSLDAVRRTGRDEYLKQAAALGTEYGVEAKRRGLSLGEATQAFLFFRARFLAEIANVARRRALASQQAASLFEEADRALDTVILALIDGHRAA